MMEGSARNRTIVELELPDGEVVLAEVAAVGGDVGAFDRFNLDQARVAVARIGAWAKQSMLTALPEPPDRFGVEVGVKLVVKSGALLGVLAETSGEASLTFTMEWDRPRADPDR